MLGAALIKVCLAYEHGVLPSNLHYSQPNPNSESLNQGILKARALLAGTCIDVHRVVCSKLWGIWFSCIGVALGSIDC